MRIGCCTNMIATGKDGIGAENIGLLSAAGFDYIELPLNGISALTESEFAGLEETVRESSIRCEGCNSFFPSSLRIIGPGSDMKRTEEYVRLVLSRAARLGSKQAGIGSGPSRSIPDGYDREKGYKYQALYSYRLIFDFDKDDGILGYLSGRQVSIPPEKIWFVNDFPGAAERIADIIKTSEN